MKKPKPTQPHKQKSEGKKKQYKVRNWKEYNRALINRGRIEFWMSEEAIRDWVERYRSGKRGKPKIFSNTAIQVLVVLQQVFRMPLRQAVGFTTSIFATMSLVLPVPDYTTLCKRTKGVEVSIRARPLRNETVHIVVDGTGIKVYGEGEWKIRQHGWTKHRTWKKLHIGVDEKTGDILLGAVTGNDKTDGDMLESLLDQLPDEVSVSQVSADGAYDKRKCYDALRKRNVLHIAIPPQHNAKIWRHGNTKAERHARDENLRRIRSIGRKRWKVEANYHRRSLSETAMFRLKTIFGDRVAARADRSQRTQLLLRCYALNRMTTLGMPESYAVA